MVGAPPSVPHLIATTFQVTLEDPAGVVSPTSEIGLSVVSPDDAIAEGDLTFPATSDPYNSSLVSLWGVHGDNPPPYIWSGTDTAITDPDWRLLPQASGTPIPRIYEDDGVFITGVTMTVLGVSYVGTPGYVDVGLGASPDWDARCFSFAVSVPFTIGDTIP